MGRKTGRAHITGEHYTHRYLWHAAETLAAKGRGLEDGGVLSMAAALFAYFAIESYANYIGPIVCPDEWAKERDFFNRSGNERYRGLLGKLQLLADRLQVSLDRGRRPYQTVVLLDQRRDAVVHGRPEHIDTEVTFKDPRLLRSIDPVICKFADEDFLQRVFDDLELLGDSLQIAAQQQLGEHDVWSPRAFRGMTGHQGGSILEMPG